MGIEGFHRSVCEVKVVWKPPAGDVPCEVFDILTCDDDFYLRLYERASEYRERGCEWDGEPVWHLYVRDGLIWRLLAL